MQIKFLKVLKPSDVAVSSARTCYFPNGLVEVEDSQNWSKKDELLSSIFKAGHHTTLQHTQITMLMKLENIAHIFILFYKLIYNSKS